MEILIREMEEKDIPKVQDLWRAVNIELTYSDKYEELVKMIKHNPGLCLVLENQTNGKDFLKNDILGAVLGGFDGRRGWIHHLAIHSSIQGKKYGTMMMDELIRIFLERDVVKLKLEVIKSNKDIIDFYKKLSWNHRTDLITMSLTLKE